ncbi:MAG: hypothetical protein ACREIC_18825, partial [Limisphaerales bacterium]
MSLIAFQQFAARLRSFIDTRCHGARATPPKDERIVEFGSLALGLFELQFENNEAYRRFCESRGVRPRDVGHWEEIPAIPSSAFKELELSVLPAGERTRAFHSSGTTLHRPSRHFHSRDSLALYEASLASWFAPHLLPDAASNPATSGPSAFLALTPRAADAPHSSLVHMFDAVARNWRWDTVEFCGHIGKGGDWELDTDSASELLLRAQTAGRPVMLLGTAFSFVQLLDSLPGNRIQLPTGSRVMETGGYKGRSRTMPKQALHSALSERLRIPRENIVSEYGMSELSSQAYDRICGAPSNHVFRFPPWARVQVISPETGQEADEGQTGLLRIFDLANAFSVLAVQTEDLGTRRGDGFELLGRLPHSEPRGC